MKVEARHVHFVRSHRYIEAIKSSENSLMYFRIDLRGPAHFPKLGERLALEGPDHRRGS
jgi:hypothetical protein